MLRCLLVAALAAPPAAPPAGTAAPVSPAASTGTAAATVNAGATGSAVAPPVPATAPVSPPVATKPTPAPTPATASPTAATDPADAPRGLLQLQSTRPEGGPVSVHNSRGELITTVQLHAGDRVRLDLPPGDYAVDDTARGGRVTLSVEPGRRARFELTPEGARGSAGEPPAPPRVRVGDRPQRKQWKVVGAPVMSAFIPGLGQMVNGQAGKGVGILVGAIAFAVGAGVLARSSGGTDVSSRGLNSGSFGTEVIGAAGYGLLSGALQMLYAAQIMDAHATAAGVRAPEPRTRHRVSLDVTRMATVGLRPGDPAAGFFPDWNLSVLGQVARRLSVGAGDLSIKTGQAFHRTTLQGGLRIHYRFYDRGRVWLGAAAGVILQGSFGRSEQPLVPAAATAPAGQGSFAAIPYAQLDLRFFILHRWSLNIVPRVSAPLAGPRFFNGEGDRAIARNAATLELGTGVGVYF